MFEFRVADKRLLLALPSLGVSFGAKIKGACNTHRLFELGPHCEMRMASS